MYHLNCADYFINYRTFTTFRVTGVNRLFGECGILLPMYGESIRYKNLPKSVRKIDKAMYISIQVAIQILKISNTLMKIAEKVLDGKLLGDTPTLILSTDCGKLW